MDTQRSVVTTSGSDPVVVTVVGAFDFASSDKLRSAVMAAAAQPNVSVVVDLSRTEFLDSVSIGILLQAWQQLHADGRELVLRSPHPRVRRVLEIAAIGDVVRVEEA